MIRRSVMLWLILIMMSGAFMFIVKYEVITREARLVALQQDIQKNRNAIDVLRAEWSYLSRPPRIEDLVERHSELEPFHISQLVTIDRIPKRPVLVDEFAGVDHRTPDSMRAAAASGPGENAIGAGP